MATPEEPIADESSPVKTPGKQRRRWRSGVVATREIRKLTHTTHNLLPHAPFKRIVKGIAYDIKNSRICFEVESIDALRDSAEDFVINTLIKANLARKHANRKTLLAGDIRFAKYMTHVSSELVANELVGQL